MFVFCDLCGHGYDQADPNVVYRDGVWVCYYEPACLERRAGVTLDRPPGTLSGTGWPGGDAA